MFDEKVHSVESGDVNSVSLKLISSARLTLQIFWYLTWAWGDAPIDQVSSQFTENWLKISTYCGISAFVLDLGYLGLTENTLWKQKKRLTNSSPVLINSSHAKENTAEINRLEKTNTPHRFYFLLRPIIAALYFGKVIPDTYILFDILASCSLLSSSRIYWVNKKEIPALANESEKTPLGVSYESIIKENKIELAMAVWSLAWTAVWHLEPFPAGCVFILTNLALLARMNIPAVSSSTTSGFDHYSSLEGDEDTQSEPDETALSSSPV